MLFTNYNTSKDCCPKTLESRPNSVLGSTLRREKFFRGWETAAAKEDKAFTARVSLHPRCSVVHQYVPRNI